METWKWGSMEAWKCRSMEMWKALFSYEGLEPGTGKVKRDRPGQKDSWWRYA